jgi:P27 family predicted phage terminase small subunit
MNYKKLKTSIEQHLEKKGNYEQGIDEYYIDILIENLDMSRTAKADLDSNGLVVTIPNGNGIATTKQNPALGAYHQAIKLVREMAHILGIGRQDRIKLKIEEQNVTSDITKLKSMFD